MVPWLFRHELGVAAAAVRAASPSRAPKGNVPAIEVPLPVPFGVVRTVGCAADGLDLCLTNGLHRGPCEPTTPKASWARRDR